MATQVMTPYSATGHSRVREVMAKTICTAKKSDTIERVGGMMKDENCGFVPVTDDGRVAGSDHRPRHRHAVRQRRPHRHDETTAGEVMSSRLN